MRPWAYLNRSSARRTSPSLMCAVRIGRFATAAPLRSGALTRVRAPSRSVDASMGDTTVVPLPLARASPLSAGDPAGREAEVHGEPTQPASSEPRSPPHPHVSAAIALVAAALPLRTPTILPPHAPCAGQCI